MVITKMIYDENGRNNLTYDTYKGLETDITVEHHYTFDEEGRVIRTDSFKTDMGKANTLTYDPRKKKLKSGNNKSTSSTNIEYDDKGRIVRKTTESTENNNITTTINLYKDDKTSTKITIVDKNTGKQSYISSIIKNNVSAVSLQKEYDLEGKQIYSQISFNEEKDYYIKNVYKVIDKRFLTTKKYKSIEEFKYYDNPVWGREMELMTSEKDSNEDGEKINVFKHTITQSHKSFSIENCVYNVAIQSFKSAIDDIPVYTIYIDLLKTIKNNNIKIRFSIRADENALDIVRDIIFNKYKRSPEESILLIESALLNEDLSVKIINYIIESSKDSDGYININMYLLNDKVEVYSYIKNGNYELGLKEEDDQNNTLSYFNSDDVFVDNVQEEKFLKYTDKTIHTSFEFGYGEYTITNLSLDGTKKVAMQYKPSQEEKIPSVVDEVYYHLFGEYYGIYSETINTLTNEIEKFKNQNLNNGLAQKILLKSGRQSIYIPAMEDVLFN